MKRFFIMLATILLVVTITGTVWAAPAANPFNFDSSAGAGNLQSLNQGLFFALSKNDIDNMVTLLDQGANPNISLNQVGLKAKGVFQNTADELAKAKVNTSSWSILTWATQLDNIDAVKVLVRYGANTNGPDENGATPLHWATWSGYHTIAKFLMDNGASCSVRDRKGNTPKEWAVMAANADMLRLFQNRTCQNMRDQDRDGVPDDRDQCPDTPFGAPVDERGCWIGAYASFSILINMW